MIRKTIPPNSLTARNSTQIIKIWHQQSEVLSIVSAITCFWKMTRKMWARLILPSNLWLKRKLCKKVLRILKKTIWTIRIEYLLRLWSESLTWPIDWSFVRKIDSFKLRQKCAGSDKGTPRLWSFRRPHKKSRSMKTVFWVIFTRFCTQQLHTRLKRLWMLSC